MAMMSMTATALATLAVVTVFSVAPLLAVIAVIAAPLVAPAGLLPGTTAAVRTAWAVSMKTLAMGAHPVRAGSMATLAIRRATTRRSATLAIFTVTTTPTSPRRASMAAVRPPRPSALSRGSLRMVVVVIIPGIAAIAAIVAGFVIVFLMSAPMPAGLSVPAAEARRASRRIPICDARSVRLLRLIDIRRLDGGGHQHGHARPPNQVQLLHCVSS